MSETLTLMRLGIGEQLAKTLCSTNPCESMIEIVRRTQRNVKRWREGNMRKRWTAAGMLEAERQFRRIVGYRHLGELVIAIERHALRVASERRSVTVTHTDTVVGDACTDTTENARTRLRQSRYNQLHNAQILDGSPPKSPDDPDILLPD